MTKRATRLTAIIAIIILAVVFFLFQSNILSSKDAPEPAEEGKAAAAPSPAEAGVLPVEAIVAKAESLLDAIPVNGSTVANEEVAVSSEVPGKIQQILFREGTLVKKGAVLIRLDQEELRAERERLTVQLKLNEKIAERLKGLYDKEGVSLQEYEVAAAEVEKVKADIALVDAQLEKRVIRAPFSGRLGLRLVSEGSYLSPGTAIVSLISINPIKLEFDVPEKYSATVDIGTKVDFRLDTDERTYQATVIAREPNIDPDTRTLRLKASAPNPDGRILPGAFAKVMVKLQEFEGAILVPTQSIVPELNSQKAYIVRNGTAQAVEVKTGIRQESRIQVIEGLSEGDTVITTGLLQVQPGAKVAVSKIINL